MFQANGINSNPGDTVQTEISSAKETLILSPSPSTSKLTPTPSLYQDTFSSALHSDSDNLAGGGTFTQATESVSSNASSTLTPSASPGTIKAPPDVSGQTGPDSNQKGSTQSGPDASGPQGSGFTDSNSNSSNPGFWDFSPWLRKKMDAVHENMNWAGERIGDTCHNAKESLNEFWQEKKVSESLDFAKDNIGSFMDSYPVRIGTTAIGGLASYYFISKGIKNLTDFEIVKGLSQLTLGALSGAGSVALACHTYYKWNLEPQQS